MMVRRVAEQVRVLPTGWLENYVAAFEGGRVQKHPQARFVNARGECCAVGAFAAAGSSAAFVESPLWSVFLGGALESISRDFEARRLTSQELYEVVLLEIASRVTERACDRESELVETA